MESITSTPARPLTRAEGAPRALSHAEIVAISYFSYLAMLSCFRPTSGLKRAVLCGVPFLLWRALRSQPASAHPWSKAIREWTCPALIILGYWLLEWFAVRPIASLQTQWLQWDRMLLDALALRSSIESLGPLLPGVLESVYLFLYAIPVAGLAIIYANGIGSKANRFLFVLFLGTFSTYALLPLIPVSSPRQAFPGIDLPAYCGPARQINTWVLDHLDISTSVFPSGHVAVAFSSAFGLLAVLRRRRWIVASAFAMAFVVYVATIYGRYHYVPDGLASMLIATTAWRIEDAFQHAE
jgi:membrane-associated phospholipid phosphatase